MSATVLKSLLRPGDFEFVDFKPLAENIQCGETERESARPEK